MCEPRQHDPEFVEYADRLHWYICRICGETWPEYQDTEGA